MNASFDRLHLVNTYGAFGSVTKVRREVIIEGTARRATRGPTPSGSSTRCAASPAMCGGGRRRSRPYHLRLGWLLWFVALSPSYGDGWLRPLLQQAARGRPPRRWRCSTTTPSTAQPPGVRARPPVPLRAHDPTGAARDRRVVATPADRHPPGADGLRPPLSTTARRRRDDPRARPTRRSRRRGGTAMPDPVADYETAASGFADVLAQCGDDLSGAVALRGMDGAGRRRPRHGRHRRTTRRRGAGRCPTSPTTPTWPTRYTARVPRRSPTPAGSRACSSRWCRHRSATARSRPR